MREPNERFTGFPDSGLAFTPLPSAFFSRLLPRIDDLHELKVTLHLFWLLHHKKGEARFVGQEELAADRTLMAGLGVEPAAAPAVLSAALEKAVARGTVLNVIVESESTADSLYFLNTGEGRRAAERLRRGELTLPPRQRHVPVAVARSRSPSAALYEQQISLLTPSVAAALARAEREYGAAAVAEAIAEAVRYEKRHWAYIKKVLENRQQRAGGAVDNGKED